MFVWISDDQKLAAVGRCVLERKFVPSDRRVLKKSRVDESRGRDLTVDLDAV